MKHTKSKLICSIVVLVVCFAMLIGSTFAWFTDSASTGVNRIQAGNLDVQLLADNGITSLEGKTLKWKKAEGHGDETVLWEPGASYNLESFYIKNNGNLNLKYKIAITGIDGDVKLNEAIDWTMTETKDENTTTRTINSDQDITLEPGDTSGLITINGTMKKEAGNKYKGLSIDGISITVYATQATGEYDSFEADYDDEAKYVERTATIMGDNGETITLEVGKAYTVGNATVTVDLSGNITYANSGTAQTVSITTDGGILTVDAPLDTVKHYGEAQVVTINNIANNSYHEFGKVGIVAIDTGRVVMENGSNAAITQILSNNAIVAVPENVVLNTMLEKSSAVNEVKVQKGNNPIIVIDNNGEAIDTDTGTSVNDNVPSELENVITGLPISSKIEYGAVIGTKSYEKLSEAVNDSQENDVITVLKDIEETEAIEIKKSLTINGNNYSVKCPNGYGERVINVNENSNDINLIINDFKIVGPTSGEYTRGLSVWQNTGKVYIELNNCELSANYYALNIAGANNHVEVLVNDSSLVGWCAAQSWSSNANFTFNDSKLVGNNDKGYNADGWNDFATLVINKDAKNNNVILNNCIIEANQTTGNMQYLSSIRSSGNKFTLEGCSYFADGIELSLEELGAYLNLYPSAIDLVLTIDDDVILTGDTAFYTLSEFNALTEIPAGIKNVYLNIDAVSLENGSVTIGNEDICDVWSWDRDINHSVGEILEDGRKVYMVRDNDTIYSSNKAGITLYISGSVNGNPEGGLNQSDSHSITFKIPDASNVVFTKDFTVNGYFRMSTGWSDGRNLGGVFYNRTVKNVLFDHSTFNGIWIQNGGFFADSLTLDGCKFNAYENRVSANDSNPLWFCNIRDCDITVQNCTFKASRPIKVVEQGVYGAEVKILNNTFDMSLTNSANDASKPKNDAIMFSTITNDSTLGNVEVKGNAVTGATSLLTFFNPSQISMADGATFMVSGNTLNEAKTSVEWKTATEYTPDFVTVN